MKRTRLRSRSTKGQNYQDEYRKASELVRARSGGRCEIRATHDCDGPATDTPHHRQLRSQGGDNSVDNLLDVCWSGHRWLHQVLPRKGPGGSEELGLIVARDQPVTPYLPRER